MPRRIANGGLRVSEATMTEIKKSVEKAAAARILFLPHAIRQMIRPERMILRSEIEDVIRFGEVIEEYPDDPRGHSCLLFGKKNGRTIHVVCYPKEDYLAIITAYIPDPALWSTDLKVRRS